MVKAQDSITIRSSLSGIVSTNEFYDLLVSNSKKILFGVNIHFYNTIFREKEYVQTQIPFFLFNDSDAIRLITKIFTRIEQEKLTMARIEESLFKQIIRFNKKVYLLGSPSEIVKKAEEQLSQKYPNVIVGYHHGFFDHLSNDECLSICKKINESNAEIVFLGMGMPLQELFAIRYFKELHASTLITCGRAFYYWSENEVQTPKLFYSANLEWLFRLIRNPVRLFKRYIIGIPVFLYRFTFNL